jgi:hypothetical protein
LGPFTEDRTRADTNGLSTFSKKRSGMPRALAMWCDAMIGFSLCAAMYTTACSA